MTAPTRLLLELLNRVEKILVALLHEQSKTAQRAYSKPRNRNNEYSSNRCGSHFLVVVMCYNSILCAIMLETS